MNCVSYLVSFGANIWACDNEHHTALEAAALTDREEIIKFLDSSATEQELKHKKVVEKRKIKALEDAEKNIKRYNRLQEESKRRLEKERKLALDKEIVDITDSNVTPVEKPTGMKKLFNTIRGKKHDTVKSSGPRMYSEHFAGLGTQRGRGGVQKVLNKKGSDQDFRDQSGVRSVRSMPGLRRDNQIMYVKGQNRVNGHNGGDQNGDNTSHLSYTHSESDVGKLNGDSGIVSDEYEDGEAGLFNRPKFGNLTFLNRPMNLTHMMELTADSTKGQDEVDEGTADNGHGVNGESDSIGSVGTLAHRLEKLPWSEEDLEPLDDDEEEETEFSALELFLAAHNLTEFLPTFTKEKVDFDALLLLSEEDLIQMGLPLGPRRKIKDALQRRKDLAEEPGVVFDTRL